MHLIAGGGARRGGHALRGEAVGAVIGVGDDRAVALPQARAVAGRVIAIGLVK
jgi:hypothetical protein